MKQILTIFLVKMNEIMIRFFRNSHCFFFFSELKSKRYLFDSELRKVDTNDKNKNRETKQRAAHFFFHPYNWLL